jgi:PAS domain S-box-containing protein
MKVLVVDDDEASRYLIATLLRGHGHEVIEAREGREALTKARSELVDVLVTDILMPVMDGYSLAREWKGDPVLARIPLIFYTASYTEPADKKFAESLGADGFYVKPQDPDLLVGLIEDALARHSAKSVAVRTADDRDETEVLREYSERLVSKLEQKLVEINIANTELRNALEVLSDEIEVKKTLIEKLTSDITERESAEAELRSAKDTLEAVIEASPLGVIAIDTRFHVTLWNPAAERMLGWSAEEAVGRYYAPISKGGRAAFEGMYGPLMAGETDSMAVEVERTTRDGGTIQLRSAVASLHDGSGHVRGMVSIWLDVTEQRHNDMVKSDFVSMISHELRTPLTSIIGYSDLLEQVDVQAKPELVMQLLAKVRDRGDRMRRLIDDLLTVSQIQSAPLRLELAKVEVGGFVAEATAKAELSERHRLVIEAGEHIPSVFLDRERMSRVLLHLISNAVKYSPDGGDVTLGLSHDDGFVRISVSDPGIGIQPSDLPHVFDRFTQADMSDTRSFGGVGLGLYLAKQVVDAHRGRVEVESTPGEGSTFTIVLPVLA